MKSAFLFAALHNAICLIWKLECLAFLTFRSKSYEIARYNAWYDFWMDFVDPLGWATWSVIVVLIWYEPYQWYPGGCHTQGPNAVFGVESHPSFDCTVLLSKQMQSTKMRVSSHHLFQLNDSFSIPVDKGFIWTGKTLIVIDSYLISFYSFE